MLLSSVILTSVIFLHRQQEEVDKGSVGMPAAASVLPEEELKTPAEKPGYIGAGEKKKKKEKKRKKTEGKKKKYKKKKNKIRVLNFQGESLKHTQMFVCFRKRKST